MIISFKKIDNFGIFRNYKNDTTQDFGKYNLIYGWNGSGKSTLSKLFQCIEKRTLSAKFPRAEFTANIESAPPLTQSNLDTASLKIYTFNQEFVKENISWNELIKSILLIDKEKIAERKKLDDLKKEQKIDADRHTKETADISNLEEVLSKFSTDSARRIKTSLQSIDTADKYYFNYDKRKFDAFIQKNESKTKSDASLLNKHELVNITNAAKPDQKNRIELSITKLNVDIFSKAKTRLDEILTASVVSQAIRRLNENQDIKEWVETGLGLHRHHESNVCEFCGNRIPEERIKKLDEHFNDSYRLLKERLEKADTWISSQVIQPIPFPPLSDFYEEFKSAYSDACISLENARQKINTEIGIWQETLKNKMKNQFTTELSVEPIQESLINLFNEAVDAIEGVVKQHNNKSANFQQETSKAKHSLELHFATAEIKAFDYHAKSKAVLDRTEKNLKLKKLIEDRKLEIDLIENSLSNEGLGSNQFNNSLHKFLGRADLSLKFNPAKKGYEIIRNGSDLCDDNLSEGEKTAIAFVYFVTKLKENDNKIEDTIVVIDDPVSSFDSNHLFHSYSFLRNSCDNSKQLFVLTHNFTFFKLMRDWFDGVNRNRKIKCKTPNAFFYTIETQKSLPRSSVIKNADSSLIKYNSEYHYIFSKLYQHKDQPSLSRDEAFLTANLSRKLLESFFSFKYPRHRSDVSQLLNSGIQGCTVTDETTKEKIYRFINKYSHSVVIETNEDSSENLVGESHNVIGDIFTWLKEVDPTHYNEMVSVVSNH
ncbi:MAG: hypothetical protein H6R16_1219 [Proteobacteria bacterium]|nr:hypothetical protein [Pseudomonadota bacterium]